MKTMKKIITIVTLVMSNVSLIANNIQITKGPEIVSRDISGNRINVQIDLSWDNSWNLNRPNNHDAAWVFMKYRIDAGVFRHANLVQAPNIVRGAGSTPSAQRYGTSRTPAGQEVTTGVFLSRRDIGFGTTDLRDVELGETYTVIYLNHTRLAVKK